MRWKRQSTGREKYLQTTDKEEAAKICMGLNITENNSILKVQQISIVLKRRHRSGRKVHGNVLHQ